MTKEFAMLLFTYGNSTSGIKSILSNLNERIERLEDKKLSKADKDKLTRAQKILVLHYLGFLKLEALGKISSNKKKADLIGKLIDLGGDNIEGDLTILHKKESTLKTVKNYEIVLRIFQDAGLKELAKEVESELTKIKKDSKNQ